MTKSQYAAGTDVPVDRSRAEFEHTLDRYGATAFGMLRDGSRTVVEFIIVGHRVRFVVDAPEPGDYRTDAALRQAERQRWRVLILLTKAKLEAIGTGHTTYEAEFLPNLVLPSGETVAERLGSDLAALPPAGNLLAIGRGR